MNKFEQLIEYVINDDESKARELFHDIVVEKSREIYENLMNQEEELDEAKHEEEDGEEEELDEAKHEEEDGEELDENYMGGDASDDLINDVETEEQGMMEEEDEEEVEFDAEEESGENLEDRVVDLEDKLDELMAEFEAMMGGEEELDMDSEEELDMGAGGDALEMDDTEEFTDADMHGMMENIDLKAAPKPVTSEEGNVNKKSTVAANSGAAGAMATPVKPTGTEAKGRSAPPTKDLIGDFQNKAGSSMKNPSAAPKPVTTQASGVNTKTPFPKG